MKVCWTPPTDHAPVSDTIQSLIPVVMAGIIAVYALVVSVLIAGNIRPPPEKVYSLYEGFMHLACGLSVGLTGLAAGYAIGIVGDMVRTHRGNIPCLTTLTCSRVSDHTCNNQESLLVWS